MFGCAFRSPLWLHRHIVTLVKKNLKGGLRTTAFEIMLQWLCCKHRETRCDHDANTLARMQKMSVEQLHGLFGVAR